LTLRLETLRGSDTRQTLKAPQHPVDRGRSITIVQILSSVQVDDKWKYASVYHRLPSSRSLGVGMSPASIAGHGLIKCQLIGVTRGLDYLHDNDIVHKNLRAVSRVYPDAGHSP